MGLFTKDIGREASPFMLNVKICFGALGGLDSFGMHSRCVRDDGVRFSTVFHVAKALQ